MAVVTTAITMVAVTMAIIMAMVDVIGTAGGTLGVARVGFGPLVVGFGPATKAGPYTIQPNSPGLGVGSLPRVGYRLVGRCTHNGHQGECLLYPRHLTCSAPASMSLKCQQRTCTYHEFYFPRGSSGKTSVKPWRHARGEAVMASVCSHVIALQLPTPSASSRSRHAGLSRLLELPTVAEACSGGHVHRLRTARRETAYSTCR
jgi:hypothetical protein